MWATILLIGSHIAFWWLRDLGGQPIWTVAVWAVAFSAFAVAFLRFESKITIGLYLAVAAVLRICLLPLPSTLSDDTLRYVWDGKLVRAGVNPYLFAPEDEALSELRDSRWEIMPHKEVQTVYPPLALGLFALGGLWQDPVLGIKILLAFCDWMGCAWLFLLARHLTIPPGRALGYAWNPLVTMEVAGQGHVDGLMVALMIGTVLLLSQKRPWGAGFAAAAGAAAKLVPLVALLPWSRSDEPASSGSSSMPPGVDASPYWRRALTFLIAAGAGTLLFFGPIAWSTGVPPGLVTYGVSWEFNGAIFEPLWRSIDKMQITDEIKGGLDHMRLATASFTNDESWYRFYHFVYPQFLAKLLLAAGFGLYWLWICRRRDDATLISGRVFGAVLLCSATLYPWYILWVLPWAALAKHRAWLSLSALSILAYLPQHLDHVSLFPWIWAAIWLPFFGLLLFSPGWTWKR